jgi:FkbM family methyltransferase
MIPSEFEFRRRLFSGLLEHCFQFCPNNRDVIRYEFDWRGRVRWWSEERLYTLLSRFGLTRRHGDPGVAKAWLEFILDNLAAFESLYRLLADQASRDRLVEVLLLRILGGRHVRLSAYREDDDEASTRVQKLLMRKNTHAVPNYIHPLHLWKFPGNDGPIKLHADGFTVRNTFLLEEYIYRSDRVEIEARPGDVVIDGGGCWGDTALYFADRIGSAGRVHSFEFDPENIRVFDENLRLNSHLKDRVRVVPFALWDVSGQKLGSTGSGAASSLSASAPSGSVAETRSIDDYVRAGCDKVDYIKLDIEGAELNALRGGESTLRTFRPKLAVCLYHQRSDFVRIPAYLEGLGLGYSFYLGHVTRYHEETVLFALPHA